MNHGLSTTLTRDFPSPHIRNQSVSEAKTIELNALVADPIDRYSRRTNLLGLTILPLGTHKKHMPFHLINYPALPEDTLRAALALYGKGHPYLQLGGHLDELLVDLFPVDIKPYTTENNSLEISIQRYLLTIIQFFEELSNTQMSEALRSRIDLKYALHMPLNSPNLDPNVLCEFRRDLISDPVKQLVLQILLKRLVELGIFKPARDSKIDGAQLLVSVCTINRIDEIVDTMYRVLESLATADPEWLRQVTIPYWYERYNRRRLLPPVSFTDKGWSSRVLRIGADIQYLLEKIEKAQNKNFSSLQEVNELNHIWEEQFIASKEGKDGQQVLEWRFSNCASCKQYSEC